MDAHAMRLYTTLFRSRVKTHGYFHPDKNAPQHRRIEVRNLETVPWRTRKKTLGRNYTNPWRYHHSQFQYRNSNMVYQVYGTERLRGPKDLFEQSIETISFISERNSLKIQASYFLHEIHSKIRRRPRLHQCQRKYGIVPSNETKLENQILCLKKWTHRRNIYI